MARYIDGRNHDDELPRVNAGIVQLHERYTAAE
jgi:hypothetical protein